MLSVASLLNPVKSEPRQGTRLPSSPPSSFCGPSSAHGNPQLSTQSSSTKKQKMTKDGAVFAKGKIKGEVNYPPFERLDEATMREVQKFQVYPLGKIQEYCRHIPYNSEKKSFLEKTGRESFEVFQYIFKVPGDEKEYCVMWDYNIGLVRITPFFKCCKYSKTTPAKMLNMNPGLKEITHSITGGALAAQGYWMPYACALEVCTTFCAHIAGALIPIFGPSFPSRCVPIEAPEHGRMIIDPQTVHEATAQAEAYRLRYSTYPSSSSKASSSRESYSPQIQHPIRHALPSMANGTQTLGRRLRLKRTFEGESMSPYDTTTDTDVDTSSGEGGAYFHSNSPPTPMSMSSTISRPRDAGNWGNHNMISHASNGNINISPASPFKGPNQLPNPLLSAIPRSTGVMDMQMALSSQHSTNQHHSSGVFGHRSYIHNHNHGGSSKRRVEEVDEEYDGGEESGSVTGTDDKGSVDEKIIDDAGSVNVSVADSGSATSVGGAEKKAAWLLMKLSVKDGESGAGAGTGGVAATHRHATEVESDGPRIKRRRATSL